MKFVGWEDSCVFYFYATIILPHALNSFGDFVSFILQFICRFYLFIYFHVLRARNDRHMIDLFVDEAIKRQSHQLKIDSTL